MPFGDRTGPAGLGPRTGRAAGYCSGYNVPGYANPYGGRYGRGYGFGFGRGWGRGFGRGWRWNAAYIPAGGYVNPISKEEEARFLKNEISLIEQELKTARERLNELEKEKNKE